MNLLNDITELRKQRGRLFAKRSLYNKQGKDIAPINKELDSIRKKLAVLSAETPKKKNQAAVAIAAIKPKMSPLETVQHAIKVYGWKNGMNFGRYGCIMMKLEKLRIKDDPDNKEVLVSFTLRYKTKRHEVENKVHWKVPYDKVSLFKNDLHNVQYGMKVQKAFTDKKFFEDKFKKAGLESKGWKIIK